MNKRESSRLESLEKRVERLTSVLIIQSILLAIMLLWSAFTYAPIIALLLLISLPMLVFYRRSLPGWARSVGRFSRQVVDVTTSKTDAEGSTTHKTSPP